MDEWMSEMADNSTVTPEPTVKFRPDDSGYLSGTPDSLGFTRMSVPAWRYKECTPLDQLFTPGMRKKCIIRQTPFPMSTEESVDLNDVEMIEVGDTEDVAMHAERIDPDDGSLYLDASLNALDHEYNDGRLKEKYQQHSLSLSTPSGIHELLTKLEFVARGPKFHNWRQRLPPDLSDRETVDFFSYLGVKSNHSLIVSKILGYLSPDDLRAVRSVSTVWRRVLMADEASKIRLKQVNKRLTPQDKENKSAGKKMRVLQHFGQLSSIENLVLDREAKPVVIVSPPVSPSKVRFHKFFKAGLALKQGDVQTTCPLCNFVSQVASETRTGKCLRLGCLYEFCSRCRRTLHAATDTCPVLGSPKSKKHRHNPMSVGSKQSRRNLQRL